MCKKNKATADIRLRSGPVLPLVSQFDYVMRCEIRDARW